MKKCSLFMFFSAVFLSLLVSSCSNLEIIKTASINIRIPVKSIVANNSGQSLARALDSADTATEENDSIYELKITLNVDGQNLAQSTQGTSEELSNKVFTFSELQVGAVVVASCDILKESNLIWTGKSESMAISKGTNGVEIIMKKVQQNKPPIDETQNPDEPQNPDDPPIEEHKHTIAAEWTSDETHHWHEASCGIESHNENKAKHDWDDGVITKEPKVGTKGEKKYTCTVCAKTKTEEISALTPNPNGTVAPDYSEISFLLVSSKNIELPKAGGIYQVAPMQKIKVAVKNSSGDDITSTMKSSEITLYHNGDEVTVKSSSSGDAIFIPHDAVGKGYTLRITVTTSGSVSYDKTISIDIVEDLEIPDNDKREYETL